MVRWFVKGTEVWNTDSTNSCLQARGTGLIISDLLILNGALEYSLALSQNKAYSMTQRYWKHLCTHKPAHSCSQQADLHVETQTQARGPSAKEWGNKIHSDNNASLFGEAEQKEIKPRKGMKGF